MLILTNTAVIEKYTILFLLFMEMVIAELACNEGTTMRKQSGWQQDCYMCDQTGQPARCSGPPNGSVTDCRCSQECNINNQHQHFFVLERKINQDTYYKMCVNECPVNFKTINNTSCVETNTTNVYISTSWDTDIKSKCNITSCDSIFYIVYPSCKCVFSVVAKLIIANIIALCVALLWPLYRYCRRRNIRKDTRIARELALRIQKSIKIPELDETMSRLNYPDDMCLQVSRHDIRNNGLLARNIAQLYQSTLE